MRCVSYCTADNYDLNSLSDYYKSKHWHCQMIHGVLQLAHKASGGEVFFFTHGCFVSWGLSLRQEKELLDDVRNASHKPLDSYLRDRYIYQYEQDSSIMLHEKFNIELINLESDNSQLKLAFSYGLAQSVKLEAFEAALNEIISNNQFIANDLAEHGKINLSRKAIVQRIGRILRVKNLINLHSDYLDCPEYFWRNSNVETFFEMTIKFLDLPKRVNALNQKLSVLQDMLDLLDGQLQYKHSSKLEWIIVALILVEILVSLFHWQF